MPFDRMIVLSPDTNPKNLEFTSPQAVTATRLDQSVYSPNCYIQIFTQLFTRNRSKLKVQRTTDCAICMEIRVGGRRLRTWSEDVAHMVVCLLRPMEGME